MRKVRDRLPTKRHLQKLALLVALVVWLVPALGRSQVKVDYPKGSKEQYQMGDEVALVLWLTVPPKTCEDGMVQTKLFQSGIAIVRQTPWKEQRAGLWQKELAVKITGSKKGRAVLTVMRKTDLQSFTQQIVFNYQLQ